MHSAHSDAFVSLAVMAVDSISAVGHCLTLRPLLPFGFDPSTCIPRVVGYESAYNTIDATFVCVLQNNGTEDPVTVWFFDF